MDGFGAVTERVVAAVLVCQRDGVVPAPIAKVSVVAQKLPKARDGGGEAGLLIGLRAVEDGDRGLDEAAFGFTRQFVTQAQEAEFV